ncbi:hypothetical protein BKA80DRAFT_94299 [Phyllosticta citrichinensis]
MDLCEASKTFAVTLAPYGGAHAAAIFFCFLRAWLHCGAMHRRSCRMWSRHGGNSGTWQRCLPGSPLPAGAGGEKGGRILRREHHVPSILDRNMHTADAASRKAICLRPLNQGLDNPAGRGMKQTKELERATPHRYAPNVAQSAAVERHLEHTLSSLHPNKPSLNTVRRLSGSSVQGTAASQDHGWSIGRPGLVNALLVVNPTAKDGQGGRGKERSRSIEIRRWKKTSLARSRGWCRTVHRCVVERG